MGKRALRSLAGAVVLSGVTITWSPFHSDVYPYTISQPATFHHMVVTTAAGMQVDYFFPSLGSSTTDVSICAYSGHALQNEINYLRSIDGRHVRAAGTLDIMGQRMFITAADFNSLVGRYTIEQVTFPHGNLIWRLTASYEQKYRSLRPIMLRMLRSFQLRG